MMRPELKALSLFSGIGGFCESFRMAGFKVVGAVENDKYAVQTYAANFPDTPLFTEDICTFLPENDMEVCDQHLEKYASAGDIDVIFGGPPCQGYSQIGPRDVKDPRNFLYKEFCRIVRKIMPDFVVIENVPNMFLMNKGQFKEEIFRELKRSGYGNIGWRKLDASEFGVPQKRNRIFVVASRNGLQCRAAQNLLESAESSLAQPIVSVNEAISDLPAEVASDSGVELEYSAKHEVSNFQKEMRLDFDGDFYSAAHKTDWLRHHASNISLHNHHTKEIQQKRQTLIGMLRPGQKANSLPKSVWDNARPEKWRRFDPDKPAHTLLAQMHRDLSEWIHPHHNRWITVREALRLQSFHDGFVLKTSEWQQLKQVGNAVPPLLGYVPAMSVRLGLTGVRGLPAPFEEIGEPDLFRAMA